MVMVEILLRNRGPFSCKSYIFIDTVEEVWNSLAQTYSLIHWECSQALRGQPKDMGIGSRKSNTRRVLYRAYITVE